MLSLSDGTPIQMQEETYSTLLEVLSDAFDEDEQEVLVEITGYVSKTSGSVSNITLNLVFDYQELLAEALEQVESFSLNTASTKTANKATWKAAKKELLTSLRASLKGKNKNDHTSRSSEEVLEVLPSVRVGYSSGLLQLQGIVEEYTEIEEGETSKRKSSDKTLAKNEILEGTFRDTDAIGSLKTLALHKDRFKSIKIGQKKISSAGFYSDVVDDAIRVFTGDKGHSKRIVLSEAGAKAVLDIENALLSYEIVHTYTHKGASKKVSSIREDLSLSRDCIALTEITSAKTVKSETLVATINGDALTVKEINATAKKSKRIGPSPSSKTFVEVKAESKKVKKGEELLFVRPKSQKIVVNLDWDNEQDLDLNCFVELQSGYKVALQPLGKNFGALEHAPYVLHSGDDRLGNSKEGEFIYCEMANLKHIKRMVVYSTIYSGASNWSQTDGIVRINVPGNPLIEVPLNEQNSKHGENECVLCTIAINDDSLSVERHVTFHSSRLFEHEGRTTCSKDTTYDFGMSWHYATKS